MKTKLFLLICLGLVALRNSVIAQSSKKDTIYYLLDTLSVPINDRIITVEKEDDSRYVKINCHCLKNDIVPTFRYNVKNGFAVSKESFSSKKLLRLLSIIDLTRQNTNKTFFNKYIFYIIEPLGDNYMMYQSFFAGSEIIEYDSTPMKF